VAEKAGRRAGRELDDPGLRDAWRPAGLGQPRSIGARSRSWLRSGEALRLDASRNVRRPAGAPGGRHRHLAQRRQRLLESWVAGEAGSLAVDDLTLALRREQEVVSQTVQRWSASTGAPRCWPWSSRRIPSALPRLLFIPRRRVQGRQPSFECARVGNCLPGWSERFSAEVRLRCDREASEEAEAMTRATTLMLLLAMRAVAVLARRRSRRTGSTATSTPVEPARG